VLSYATYSMIASSSWERLRGSSRAPSERRGGDRFYFASSSGSRKVKNVEQNFSASVVVDARESGRERWVSASGLVEILRDSEAQSIKARIRRRYLAPKALDGPIEAALRASDDVTLRLTPTGWRSWTAPIVDSPEGFFLAGDA
jgi:hypothetical protein